MSERGWASRELRRAGAELNELPAFVRLLAGEINAREYRESLARMRPESDEFTDPSREGVPASWADRVGNERGPDSGRNNLVETGDVDPAPRSDAERGGS